MRKGKNELLRLQTMIENDRIAIGDNFLQLVENDLVKLLRDYFDFLSNPSIRIESQNNGYYLSFSLNVSRIKNFASISSENIDVL